MEEQLSSPAATPPAVTSFMTRAANVFAAPGELYDEVAANRTQTSSWLIPFILSILLAVLFTVVIYNNPVVRQQIYDTQGRAFDKRVTDGKMTQQEADQARDKMEKLSPAFFIAIGSGTAAIAITLMYFGVTLLLWLIAKFGLKFQGDYPKMLEVFGLAGLISILGSIVMLILVNLFDSLYATPGAALAVVGSFDPLNPVHRFLSACNVFTIWQASVLGFGISKISGRSAGVGIGITLGLWLVWALASSFLNL
jgi:hypothetical protein